MGPAVGASLLATLGLGVGCKQRPTKKWGHGLTIGEPPGVPGRPPNPAWAEPRLPSTMAHRLSPTLTQGGEPPRRGLGEISLWAKA